MSGASERCHEVESVKGPVGVQSRNFSNGRIYSTGWQARFPLIAGIKAREGRAAEVGRWPRRLGLDDKLACVVAHRSGASDRVTLGCRFKWAARRSLVAANGCQRRRLERRRRCGGR